MSGPTVCGEVQGVKAAVPSRHSNVEFGFVELKLNAGDACLVGTDGPVRIAVSGVVVSTVKVRVAGEPSTLPATSTARTANV